MTDPSRRDILRLGTLIVTTTPLASCGGGSGGGDSSSAAAAPAPAPPAPAPAHHRPRRLRALNHRPRRHLLRYPRRHPLRLRSPLWRKGYGPELPYLCDLASGNWTAGVHPDSEAKRTLDALHPSPGMIYAPQLDAYLVRGSAPGGRVLAVAGGTLEVSYLATTGGDAIPLGTPHGVGAANEEEGVYNRWLLAPNLKGVVYCPSAPANAWFLRLYLRFNPKPTITAPSAPALPTPAPAARPALPR